MSGSLSDIEHPSQYDTQKCGEATDYFFNLSTPDLPFGSQPCSQSSVSSPFIISQKLCQPNGLGEMQEEEEMLSSSLSPLFLAANYVSSSSLKAEVPKKKEAKIKSEEKKVKDRRGIKRKAQLKPSEQPKTGKTLITKRLKLNLTVIESKPKIDSQHGEKPKQHLQKSQATIVDMESEKKVAERREKNRLAAQRLREKHKKEKEGDEKAFEDESAKLVAKQQKLNEMKQQYEDCFRRAMELATTLGLSCQPLQYSRNRVKDAFNN